MAELNEEKLQKIETLLEKDRKEWSGNIQTLIKDIKEAHKLAKAQTYMLSYRHMIVDKMMELNIMLGKKRANDSNYTKMRYQHYKTNHDIRLDHKEILEYIKSDMALRNRETNLIENQVTYYKQCIETLDKMGFAIKNRVTLATNDI
jgi:gluconate kinase